MRSLRLGLVGAVLLLLGATLAVWPARAVQKDVHVVMTGIPATPFAFSPGTQTASGGGDTVKWINDTPAEHTATSNDGTSFDVSIPASPGSAVSPAFTGATRDIAYHCKIHPYMTGTIHVEAAIANPTTTTTIKPTTTTAKPIGSATTKPATTTSRATTSTTETSTTETIDFNTTTSEETTTTAGQVAIKTKSSGGNGAAVAVLVLALAAVFGGGGYALYRMRRP